MLNEQNNQNQIIRFLEHFIVKSIYCISKRHQVSSKKTDLEHIYTIYSIKLCLQSR